MKFINQIIQFINAFILKLLRKSKMFAGKTEFLIPVISGIGWLIIAAGGKLWGWDTYSIGYFQKLFFGTMVMSIITGVGWIWFGATFPHLKATLDPDTMEYKMLSTWEKIKLSFWLYALYVGGVVVLVSLY